MFLYVHFDNSVLKRSKAITDILFKVVTSGIWNAKNRKRDQMTLYRRHNSQLSLEKKYYKIVYPNLAIRNIPAKVQAFYVPLQQLQVLISELHLGF